MQQEKPLYPLLGKHWNKPFVQYFVCNYGGRSYFIVEDRTYSYCLASQKKDTIYWEALNANSSRIYCNLEFKLVYDKFDEIKKNLEKYLVLI